MESRDVISHVTIRLSRVDFLWVAHSDHAFVLHRYDDISPQILDAQTWTQKERRKNGKRIEGVARLGGIQYNIRLIQA